MDAYLKKKKKITYLQPPQLEILGLSLSVLIMGFGARSKKGKKKNKIYINNNSQINNKIDKGAKEYINNKRRKK